MKVTLDIEPLKNLMTDLGEESKVRVGVLGSDNARSGKADSNASIGLKHEFGSIKDKIPPRSFIRMPLEQKSKQIEAFLSSEKIRQLFEQGEKSKILTLLGIKAENIIQQAFRTGGFGKWPANRPSTVARKGSSKPLIDTSQLRRSISSEVV
jgi:hypothetical protein